jgi:hypothetical protein
MNNSKQIVLKKIDNNHFSINLEIHNKNNVDIRKFFNVNLFQLMGQLNPDIIETADIKNNISNREIDMLYVFKQFGEEFGIKKKYMYIKNLLLIENENYYIKSYSIPYNSEISIDCINNEFGYLKIEKKDNNMYNLFYEFKMTMEDILPPYMQNIIGNIMKKIFINYKEFIEKVNINSND